MLIFLAWEPAWALEHHAEPLIPHLGALFAEWPDSTTSDGNSITHCPDPIEYKIVPIE
jgi:hypothetical protein